jgi:hypothetical protein
MGGSRNLKRDYETNEKERNKQNLILFVSFFFVCFVVSLDIDEWRWRESNSRLQAVFEGIYILSRFARFSPARSSRSDEELRANYVRRFLLSGSDLRRIASLLCRRPTSRTQAMRERTGSNTSLLTRLPLRVQCSQLNICLQFTGYKLPGMHPSLQVFHRTQCTPIKVYTFKRTT